MSVTHDWQCLAHGHFEARGSAKKKPKCPKGCSPGLVSMVFLQPVGYVSARTRKGDKLVKEMAAAQGLSDISTSPSRPGGTVAQRNAARNRPSSNGAAANPYDARFAPRAGGGAGLRFAAGDATVENLSKLGFGGDNALTRLGLGHGYDKREWKTDPATGAAKHVGAGAPVEVRPPASVERVRGETK